MANLKAPKNDEISSASVITELIPFHTSRKQHNSGLESWSCAFSPDESYFVWSSGNSVVTLLPWGFCKHTVFKNKKVTVPFTSGVGKHDAEDCFGCNTKSINTGHTVRSVAFGTSTLYYGKRASPFWARLSSSKDLVLATGHANGRIRTWDVVTVEKRKEKTQPGHEGGWEGEDPSDLEGENKTSHVRRTVTVLE
ncbi:WD repeat and SOCS box-containing protein 1 [Trichonephila clavipes]|nr:WD repeat and SOCS box-containing protein 1 [Trichonephila clavipes]